MPSTVETTAAMTDPAEQLTPADAPDTGSATAADVAALAAASVLASDAATRRSISPGVVISLFGGLVTTLLGALIGLMMWQFSSLGSRIEAQGVRIDNLGAELRVEIGGLRSEVQSEIGGLRAEMREGFRAVNATLLDHTDRLARLEAVTGLPRITDADAAREDGR